MTRVNLQRRSLQTDFRSVEADGRKRIEGYFALYDSPYELFEGATETIARGAFDGSLDGDIRALVNHDSRLVLGRTTAGTLRLRVDERGLWGSVDINEDDTDATNLYARVRRGDVSQCSFGFELEKERRDVNPSTGEIHWTLERVKLHEVSCCTFPAYTQTEVTARADEYEGVRRRRAEAWRAKMKGRLQTNGA